MQRTTRSQDSGFTLVELLVVVLIIGILSSIAIPTFLSQREKAWDKAVKSDLRNNAVKMEEYRDDDPLGAYPPADPGGDYAFKQSETNEVTVVESATTAGFCLKVVSEKDFATDTQFFDSGVGRPTATDCSAVYGP